MRCLTVSLLIAPSLACALGSYTIQAPQSLSPAVGNELFGFSVSAARKIAPGQTAVGIASGPGGRVQLYTMPFASTNQLNLAPLGVPIASPATLDNFGFTVAVNQYDTFTLAAVGAPGDDAGNADPFNAGKVYLYRSAAAGAAFVSEAVINPPALNQFGNFGTSVAIADNILAIGEPRARVAGTEVGAVHLYAKIGPSWLLQTSIFGTVSNSRFGNAVALSGNTLVIGAPVDVDNASLVSGAVYVYTGAGALWTQQQKLIAQDREANDRLGLSVSIDGDSLVAGAANDDKVVGADAGSAYVFTRSGSVWTEQAKLRSTQAQINERFAQSVSIEADEVLVGAYCLNVSGCVGSGAVYVFNRTAGVWAVSARLASGVNQDSFGHSVSHGSGNAAIVGAFGVDTGQTDAGAVYGLAGVELIFRNGFED
jgi:hypothetical protein